MEIIKLEGLNEEEFCVAICINFVSEIDTKYSTGLLLGSNGIRSAAIEKESGELYLSVSDTIGSSMKVLCRLNLTKEDDVLSASMSNLRDYYPDYNSRNSLNTMRMIIDYLEGKLRLSQVPDYPEFDLTLVDKYVNKYPLIIKMIQEKIKTIESMYLNENCKSSKNTKEMESIGMGDVKLRGLNVKEFSVVLAINLIGEFGDSTKLLVASKESTFMSLERLDGKTFFIIRKIGWGFMTEPVKIHVDPNDVNLKNIMGNIETYYPKYTALDSLEFLKFMESFMSQKLSFELKSDRPDMSLDTINDIESKYKPVLELIKQKIKTIEKMFLSENCDPSPDKHVNTNMCRRLIGTVSVDSGKLMIVDPGYVEDFWKRTTESLIIGFKFWGKNMESFAEYLDGMGYALQSTSNGTAYLVKTSERLAISILEKHVEDHRLKFPNDGDLGGLVYTTLTNSSLDVMDEVVHSPTKSDGVLNDLGLLFTPAFGDGVYSVYATYVDVDVLGHKDQMISKVEIVLIEEDEIL